METLEINSELINRPTQGHISSGQPLLEVDHRFLKSAVPKTIGDQQTDMALLGFLDYVHAGEHASEGRYLWFRLLAKFSALKWVVR